MYLSSVPLTMNKNKTKLQKTLFEYFTVQNCKTLFARHDKKYMHKSEKKFQTKQVINRLRTCLNLNFYFKTKFKVIIAI